MFSPGNGRQGVTTAVWPQSAQCRGGPGQLRSGQRVSPVTPLLQALWGIRPWFAGWGCHGGVSGLLAAGWCAGGLPSFAEGTPAKKRGIVRSGDPVCHCNRSSAFSSGNPEKSALVPSVRRNRIPAGSSRETFPRICASLAAAQTLGLTPLPRAGGQLVGQEQSQRGMKF